MSLYEATVANSERVSGPDRSITKVVRRNLDHTPAEPDQQPGIATDDLCFREHPLIGMCGRRATAGGVRGALRTVIDYWHYTSSSVT
jgi:hypothetical protein